MPKKKMVVKPNPPEIKEKSDKKPIIAFGIARTGTYWACVRFEIQDGQVVNTELSGEGTRAVALETMKIRIAKELIIADVAGMGEL